MRAQVPIAVHVGIGGIGVRIVGFGHGIAAAVDFAGRNLHLHVVGHARRDVVRRILHREHPHERTSLLDVGVHVMEPHVVRVGGTQMGVTFRDALRIGDIVDVLQLADTGIVGRGVDEQPDRILLVDVELSHQEIGQVVESVRRLRIVARPHDLRRREHLARQLGALVGDIGHETVLALHDTETRPDAMRQIARVGRLRQARIGFDASRFEPVVRRHVDLLVALLIVIGHTVLQAQLRILRNRFGIGHVAAQVVAERRRMRTLVAQQQGIRRNDDQIGIDTPRLVRIAVRISSVVPIAHAAVERQRAAVLAQLRAIGEVLVQIDSRAVAVAEIVHHAQTALSPLVAISRAVRIVALETEPRARHE